ncbi:MAG: hypothetical protein KC983_00185 [Phycisphaerales bacterium]|nr:hypothetical protein [Phycisphaerales bacterium]
MSSHEVDDRIPGVYFEQFMARRLIHFGQRCMILMLILSVSICCCDLHAFAGGGHVSTAASGRSVPACCANCVSDAADDTSTPDSERKGCAVCCIKGSGLKDAGYVLLNGPITLMPIAVPAATPCVEIPNTPKSPLLDGWLRPDVDPPTLLRLHCALIV